MKQALLAFYILLSSTSVFAQDTAGLTGPAYAAAMKERLQKLQAKNAESRKSPKKSTKSAPSAAKPAPSVQLTGPAYSATRTQMLRRWQSSNAASGVYNRATGPYYAAYTANVKANQRFWNGTWLNNYYYPPFYLTPPPKPGSVSNLSDPWLWYWQQPYGWFQQRY